MCQRTGAEAEAALGRVVDTLGRVRTSTTFPGLCRSCILHSTLGMATNLVYYSAYGGSLLLLFGFFSAGYAPYDQGWRNL